VLTVRAERRPVDLGEQAEAQLSERPLGVFARQLFLSDALDTQRIDATYDNGVLVLRIPIAEKAKPRKVAVAGRQQATDQHAINA
jgi:HSP20 family protein